MSRFRRRGVSRKLAHLTHLTSCFGERGGGAFSLCGQLSGLVRFLTPPHILLAHWLCGSSAHLDQLCALQQDVRDVQGMVRCLGAKRLLSRTSLLEGLTTGLAQESERKQLSSSVRCGTWLVAVFCVFVCLCVCVFLLLTFVVFVFCCVLCLVCLCVFMCVFCFLFCYCCCFVVVVVGGGAQMHLGNRMLCCPCPLASCAQTAGSGRSGLEVERVLAARGVDTASACPGPRSLCYPCCCTEMKRR